jgi:hypothetical protein
MGVNTPIETLNAQPAFWQLAATSPVTEFSIFSE